ncbi:Transient receptor putative cation channel sub V member 5 [Cladochytrium tenue]|nr:Transient receptor putative cation channel sub V member 5 [Cladochytrium tenue]
MDLEAGVGTLPSAPTETHPALPTELLKNVQAGNLELVRKQILEGNRITADIENRVGPENETILHFAILRNGEIAEMIAEAASDNFLAKSYTNERYFGETALHLAVVQNRPEVIDILLGCRKLDMKALATGYEFAHGTKHKGTHYAGMTALQFAVYHSTSKVVEKLLIGADMRKLFGINDNPAAAKDLIEQDDLYGNNLFHIMAMRKSPANAQEVEEIKNINSAIRQRLIFQNLRANARISWWKYFFCGLVIVIFTVRGVVLLSHQSMVSLTTTTDYADLSPLGNTTADSFANGTSPALGSWLQLENFLFSAASICAWCNMLYFFKAFKSAGVLFRAFREILVDILTWSTMFVVFCLAFGGALFIQMEASDNDPWAPYWWTLVWVARVTLQSGNYDAIAAGATIPAIAIILYLAFSFVMLIVLGFDGTQDKGRFIALVEINANDGVPANVRKAVVGYWDENYQLSPPADPSTSGATTQITARLQGGEVVSSVGTDMPMQEMPSPHRDTAALPDAGEFNAMYRDLLAKHMPVELRIAEDYWAHWLSGLWHIFAVCWVWGFLRRRRIFSFMIYKKADLDLLQSGVPPSDRNLWFGHPLVIRQKLPSTIPASKIDDFLEDESKLHEHLKLPYKNYLDYWKSREPEDPATASAHDLDKAWTSLHYLFTNGETTGKPFILVRIVVRVS